MSDFHDLLAEETLRLAENLRAVDTSAFYGELVARCRKEPERVAQMLMCALVWVDVESPVANLIHRAEDVAADNARVMLRSVPDIERPVEVVLRKDIVTDGGVLAAGSRHWGTPEVGGMWRLQVGDSSLTVPEAVVRAGARKRGTLLRARDAREEYGFARRTLGYGHHAAVAWLLEHYEVSEKQLERWQVIGARAVAS